jgi:hypothetical protein
MQQNLLPAETSGVQTPWQRRGKATTVILALVAIIGIAAAIYFWRSQQTAVGQLSVTRAKANRAEENFKASRGAIDSVVANLADGLGTGTGLQAEAIAAILTGIEKAVDTLVTKTHDDAEVRRSQASMYVQFSATYLTLGDAKLAVDNARKGTEIFRALAAEQPNNNAVRSDVGLSLGKLGEALRASGDNRGALAADRESLDIARSLADKEPGNRQFRTDVVLALWHLASVGDSPRERLTEALKLLKNLKIAAMLTPAQEEWMAMIESDLAKL